MICRSPTAIGTGDARATPASASTFSQWQGSSANSSRYGSSSRSSTPRHRRTQPAVQVDGDVHAVADLLPHGGDRAHRRLHAGRRLQVAPRLALGDHLQRREALIDQLARLSRFAASGVDAHAIAHRAAEQPPHRLADRLAGDVPHRHLQAAQRADQDRHRPRVAGAVQHLPVVLDPERVAPDQVAGELLDRGHHQPPVAVAQRLAVADDAGVGAHLQQQRPVVEREGARAGDLQRSHGSPPQAGYTTRPDGVPAARPYRTAGVGDRAGLGRAEPLRPARGDSGGGHPPAGAARAQPGHQPVRTPRPATATAS